MAYTSVKELFVAICDAIRAKKGTSETINHQDIPSEITSIESGDSYYDTFWDNLQQNGNRLEYDNAFYGTGWNDANFKPKYPILWTGNNVSATHRNVGGVFYSSRITNLAERLRECGMNEIDLLPASQLSSWLGYSYITRFPKVIFGISAQCQNIFKDAIYLEIVEEITFPQGQGYELKFQNCPALKETNVKSLLTKNYNAQTSPLITVEDAINTILHLEDHFNGELEFTTTISFHADVWERLKALGEVAPGTIEGEYVYWEDYVSNIGWSKA